jgi:hypothetical protein
VLELRVTKYDPALRDSRGAYTRKAWTTYSDIGKSFDGVVLTREEYERVEDAYATTAVAFLREAGLPSLTVAGLEGPGEAQPSLSEASQLGLADVGEVVRRMLREELWCRLESADAFIHIGWDYYMYVGVPRRCPRSEALARQLGLFVELFQSPYRKHRQR